MGYQRRVHGVVLTTQQTVDLLRHPRENFNTHDFQFLWLFCFFCSRGRSSPTMFFFPRSSQAFTFRATFFLSASIEFHFCCCVLHDRSSRLVCGDLPSGGSTFVHRWPHLCIARLKLAAH